MSNIYLFLTVLFSFIFSLSEARDLSSLSDEQWQELSAAVQGRLVKPESLMELCIKDSNSANCQKQKEKMNDPFYLETETTQKTSALGLETYSKLKW